MAPRSRQKEMARKVPVELDGRHLEGGGQLLRIALGLSALTGQPVRITDIRGNRSGGGGLKAQHLACVKWLAHACNADVEGDVKGSKTLDFRPGVVEGGLSPAFKKRSLPDGTSIYETRLDIGTAGSTGLALQAILPFILFTRFPSALPIHLTITGGTNVSGSPSVDYIRHVLLPTLHSIGLPAVTITHPKRGWSQGGASIGSMTLIIPPRTKLYLPPFTLPPRPRTTTSSSSTAIHALYIGPTSTHSHFLTTLPGLLQPFSHAFSSSPPTITCEASLHEKRFYLLLTATTSTSPTSPTSPPTIIACDALVDFRIRDLNSAATSLAQSAVAGLVREWRSEAAVDEFLRDQLVVYQALAGEGSMVFGGWEGREAEEEDEERRLREPSLHARTAEWVAKRMLGVRFDVEGRCEGCGSGREGDEELEEMLARTLIEG